MSNQNIFAKISIKAKMFFVKDMSKTLFTILSITLGIIPTLIGTFAMVWIVGMNSTVIHRYGYCYYVTVKKPNVCLNFGLIWICSTNTSKASLTHLLGHSIQNAMFGPFALFIYYIPMLIRNTYRKIRMRLSHPSFKAHDAIWFEKQATRIGEKFAQYHRAICKTI